MKKRLRIRFHNDVQFSHITFSHIAKHIFKFRFLLTSKFHFTELTLTV